MIRNAYVSLFTIFSAFMLISSNYLISSEQKVDTSIIPNASYFIYDEEAEIIGGVPLTSKHVTFYTFDGNPITKVEHHFSHKAMERKLDPKAPKPQPIAYQIKYWPAIRIGKVYKGVPGDFIIFYDKNGNRIESYRFDKTKQEITECWLSSGQPKTHTFQSLAELQAIEALPLDLKQVQEKTDNQSTLKKASSIGK